MPRATCRCGQVLNVPADGSDRVVCPNCAARVRVRRDTVGDGDGFVRFACECGRRLKVRTESVNETAQTGKCPDCGRVVPVPTSSSSGGDLKLKVFGPETPTEELDEVDVATLDKWTRRHLGDPVPVTPHDPAAPASLARPRAPAPAPFPSPATAPFPTAPSLPPPPAGAAPLEALHTVKAEAGLRVCPRCGRPLHLSAVACRSCGSPVPKR